MAKLRIGPLPDDRPIKRTITFTAALDALIRDYSAALAAQDGLSEAPPVEKLVPDHRRAVHHHGPSVSASHAPSGTGRAA